MSSTGGRFFYARWFALGGLAVLTAACAVGIKAGDSVDDTDAATTDSDGGNTSTSSGSTSSTSSSSGNADAGKDAASASDAGKDVVTVQPTGCSTLLINEVQTAGNGGSEDEFIEIYNPNSNPCSLATWKVVYRSASGTSDVTMYSGTAASPSVPSNGYVVLGGASFSGASQADLTNAMAGSGGGQLALKDGTTVVDSLGYGNASGAYVRGSAAPLPGSGKSIARTPNGKDSKNNQSDFTVVSSPSPGQSN